ncbi:uncharacterized protein METZ01_LOCUS339633, partial [marine metagenome]
TVPNVPPDNLDSNGTLVMNENEPIGTIVGVFSAVDPDGNGSLYYYLYGTHANFTMDLNGTLRTATILDYEANASHQIQVRVYDDLQAYVEGNFTVTVLDVNETVPNVPPDNLDSNGTLVMRENEPIGTTVGVFSADDPDGNGSLHYYLHGTHAFFTMDLNGTLRTAAVLDYEANTSHQILVRVYDDMQAYAEGNFTVTVLDVNETVPNPNSPPDNLNSNGTLVMRENEPVGTTVGVFSAVDPDGNGSLHYYLHGTHANFTMDLNGTLRTAAVLDFEANASHQILVRVYDDMQAYVEGNFTVTVLDVNETVPNPNVPPDNLDSNGTLVMRE